MPRWRNQLIGYHGTDDSWLNPNPGTRMTHTGGPLTFVPNLAQCKPYTDFGQGFYITTHQHQAEQWANAKVFRTPGRTALTAIVLSFQLDRDWLSSLDSLSFVRPNTEFWDLVTDCRGMFPPHQRPPPSPLPYDVVYGPVSVWRQLLVLGDCDQISFHTRRAISGLPQPTMVSWGTQPDGGDFVF